MELLKERIRKDGVVKEGNVLKVDRFLNHQMDVKLFREIGKEFKKLSTFKIFPGFTTPSLRIRSFKSFIDFSPLYM